MNKEKSKLTLKEKRALKKKEQKKSETKEAKLTAVEKKSLKIEKAEAELLAAAARLAEMKTSVEKKRVENGTALEISEEEAKISVEDVPPQVSDTKPPIKDLETIVKICRVCNKSKSIEQFSRDKATKDGLDTVCKSCGKEYRSPVAKAARARLKARKKKRLEQQNNK